MPVYKFRLQAGVNMTVNASVYRRMLNFSGFQAL